MITDTERLDFMIENCAWVQGDWRDSPDKWQCWTDVDRNPTCISGEHFRDYFPTPRDAIDAAMGRPL